MLPTRARSRKRWIRVKRMPYGRDQFSPTRNRKVAGSNPVAPIILTPFHRLEQSRRKQSGRRDICLNKSTQKNGALKKFEERRVLCAFASMGECPVAVLWVRRSETNRPSKCLEDTRGELARKGLTHRRMSNDSPKIQWSCQRVNEQVGVGIPRQFSGRDGLLDQVYIHGSSRQIETFEEESPKHGICLNITDQADGDG
jgi:hypothetical protein